MKKGLLTKASIGAFALVLTAIATIWGLKRVIRMFSGA